MNILRTLIVYRELLRNLVVRDLKSRYKGSVLGFLWTLLTPLFMAAIYIFFLQLIAGRGVPIRHTDIIIGVFAWTFTVQAVTSGMNSVTANANLVNKVFFPRIILPVATVLSALITFLLMVSVQLVLVGFMLYREGGALSPWVLGLPVIIVYHTLFNMAVVLFVAASNVYFRDTQHIINLLLSAWFFMSPVMYTLALVDTMAGERAWITSLYQLNPLAVIITGYRALHMPDVAFPLSGMAQVGWLWPMVLLIAGYFVYQRAQKYFSDWL